VNAAPDTGAFVWTWVALPALIGSVAIAIVGLRVVVRERASRLSVLYLLLMLATAVWQATVVGIFCVVGDRASWVMAHVATLAALSILPLQYQFAVAMAGRERWRSVAWVWMLTIALAVTLVTTDQFITRLDTYGWGRFARYGPAGWVFIGLVSIVAAAAMALYWDLWRSSPPGSLAARRGLVLLVSLAIGVTGVIDFAPTLGIDVFPFGGTMLAAAGVVSGVVIVRLRLTAAVPVLAVGELLDALADGALVLDRDGIVRLANRAASELLDHRVQELRDAPLPPDIAALLPGMPRDGGFPERGFQGIERSWRTPHGARRVLSLSLSHVRDRGDEIEGAVLVLRDITASRLEALTVSETSTDRLDAVTGLPWSSHAHARFSVAMARADRARAFATVMVVDLDAALAAVPAEQRPRMLARLAREVQATLRGGDELLRRGDGGSATTPASDALVMLLSPTGDAVVAAAAARRALGGLKRALADGWTLPPEHVSIGVALYPQDADEGMALERRAAAAARAARESGGGVFRFHERAGDMPVLEADALHARAAAAAGVDTIALRWAPVVDVEHERVAAWAAAVWSRSGGGEWAPLGPHLPDYGQRLVDRWALAEAVDTLLRWDREAVPVARVIVPVRARTLLRRGFRDRLGAMTAPLGDARARFVVAVRGPLPDTLDGSAATMLARLERVGVPLLFDGFARGPVVLHELASLPCRWLRFDVVAGLSGDAAAARVALADGLGAALIAAGVDDVATADLLRAAGCRLQQGRVHGVPVDTATVPRRRVEARAPADERPTVAG
nr:EAL domain-containing protein [Burkholderiales bacterium]